MLKFSMNGKYFTGIGSRETPERVCSAMTQISSYLEHEGYTLRSGGADGADLAFERGMIQGHKEIWLPWLKFNKSDSLLLPTSEAFSIAATVHPVWDRLSPAAKKLHARNCHQVLGETLDDPSAFLLCWTPNGKIAGGSATAINLAMRYNVPVFNLATVHDENYIDGVKDFLTIIGEI